HRMNSNLNPMRIVSFNEPIRCPSSWTPEHRMHQRGQLFATPREFFGIVVGIRLDSSVNPEQECVVQAEAISGFRKTPMSDAATFPQFVQRIRAGDQSAAEELVRQYEPLIRREVRLHLEDRRLERLF